MVQCGEPGCCSENPPLEETEEKKEIVKKSIDDHPIAAKLRMALEAEHVEVIDESDGCGAKLQIVVVSKQFEGKMLLAQHRAVNAAIADDLKTVHAFNVKTYTPAKWQAAQQKKS